MSLSIQKVIQKGVSISQSALHRQDKVWSKYSSDKVDIGEALLSVLRALFKAFPLSKPLRALSIGSSTEPQFRILQPAFRGGLYLLDIEKAALDIVQERARRQGIQNVFTLLCDFNKVLRDRGRTRALLKRELHGKRVELINFHHSLYYAEASAWLPLFRHVYGEILAPQGAVHAVLMASRSENPMTTTWLYNHFAGKFCGHRNDQCLRTFQKELERDSFFSKAQMVMKTRAVRFFVDDFEKFMAVVWMILLYPQIHRYTLGQRYEITEHVYKNFFAKRKPLIQMQDHLVVCRGIKPGGLF